MRQNSIEKSPSLFGEGLFCFLWLEAGIRIVGDALNEKSDCLHSIECEAMKIYDARY